MNHTWTHHITTTKRRTKPYAYFMGYTLYRKQHFTWKFFAGCYRHYRSKYNHFSSQGIPGPTPWPFLGTTYILFTMVCINITHRCKSRTWVGPFYFDIWQIIIMASHGRSGVSSYRQRVVSFNSSFKQTKTKIRITGHLWAGTTDHCCIPSQRTNNLEQTPILLRRRVKL